MVVVVVGPEEKRSNQHRVDRGDTRSPCFSLPTSTRGHHSDPHPRTATPRPRANRKDQSRRQHGATGPTARNHRAERYHRAHREIPPTLSPGSRPLFPSFSPSRAATRIHLLSRPRLTRALPRIRVWCARARTPMINALGDNGRSRDDRRFSLCL